MVPQHLIQSLLTYLNQSYAKPRGLESAQIYGLNRFRQYLLLDGSIDQTLSQCVKRWLTEERDDAANTPHLHRAAFASLFKHLQTHGLYGEYEDDYCRLTRDYYMAESDRLSKELGPDAFLDHIMSRIDVEVDRAKDVLSVGSWEIIRKVSEEAFCKERLHWIASSAVGALADKDDKKKLKETYELFSRVNGLAKLCNVWKSYVNRKVTAIVTDKEQDAQMVDRLLEFRDQASRTVEHCFLAQKPEGKPMTAETLQGEGTAINSSTEASSSAIPARAPNQDFVYALTDAFGTGFKSRRSKPAEMIARYLDTTLRKGQKNASDKDFEKSLDAALSLYRYTEDKDVFRTFYHRALARRLLLQKSASDDFEIAMLKKLQNNYDPEFGMGEEMFKDLALSREMMNKFNEKQPANGFARRLTVMVLKRSAWPFTVSTGTIDLPPKMQDALISFAESYKAIHSGHKLDWDHALGTATLSARFNAGEKELSVSLYQAVILLMFADGEKRSFAEIKESAGNLDDGDLRRTLQSLACGKKRVLTKSPPGKNVNDGDIFRVNAEFTDSAYKIHINSIQAKVSEEEHQKTQFSIEGERKHILDAAIVRIMKGRKEMRMQDLQNSVIDAVKKHFTPKVPDVKKRIEAMVEQEYIERTEEQNTFRYVA
ncbi:Cullin [Schizophyllum amplum]|uniref:Cullin n=1 Tax=Schizophyllum amplum TaxID=97359 RepID=A0A550CNG7_9AGAR|nr:Cullin [Auriculariopsis ampla]